MNKRPIVFFLMSSGIGGEVITFLRMADWLAKNTERDVYVTDFKNGCVFKYMEQDGIKSVNKLIIPDCLSKNIKRFSQDTKLKLPDNALVFTNAFWAFSKGVIGELLSGNNVNFLFYFVDPNTVSDVSNRFSWLKRMIFLWKVRKIFRFCNKKKALVYQDYPNYVNVKKLVPNVEERYLPIPLQIPALVKTKFCRPENISFCYIGRNCRSKNNTLKFYVNNLVAYAQKYPEKRLKLFVVSDIKSKAAFFRRLKKPENFSLIFKGKMFGEELEKFLRKSVDIVLAMGVSCLEGAKLRLVSISAPASNKKIPVSVPVTLISDFCKYSTGGYWKKDNGYLKRYAFSDLIDTVTENYDHYADACYQYVKDNFQIDTIMPFFLRFLDKTQLSLDDMELKKWKYLRRIKKTMKI